MKHKINLLQSNKSTELDSHAPRVKKGHTEG